MIYVDEENLVSTANKMADMLDDLVNTLANYRNLQGKDKDFVGCSVTTKQITDIRALLDSVDYQYI